MKRIMLVLAAVWPLCSNGSVITFSEVVSTDDSIPGTGERFSFFTQPVMDANGAVAFRGGSQESGAHGIFFGPTGGPLRVVADKTTYIPGSTLQPHGFSDPSIGNGGVVFSMANIDRPFTFCGCLDIDGSLGYVINQNTLIPGTNVPFAGVGDVGIDEAGNVAFIGALPSSVYVQESGSSSLRLIADTSTLVPGGVGTFQYFLTVDVDGGTVAFKGQDGITSDSGGVYIAHGDDSLKVIADRTTPLPNGVGAFEAVFNPVLDGTDVAFRGFGSNGQAGIYTASPAVGVVADTSTAIQDGVGYFTAFGLPSYRDGRIAFTGFGSGQQGIYITASDGSLERIVDLSMSLGGKTLSGLSTSSEALSTDSIGFLASFTDGSSAIYVAHIAVPEPGTLLLLFTGLLGLGSSRRR
jgi:hypothetical protein